MSLSPRTSAMNARAAGVVDCIPEPMRLWPKGALPPFKREAVNTTATQAINEVAAYLVDMAKAQTLDAMGEQSVAIEFVKRHVGP